MTKIKNEKIKGEEQLDLNPQPLVEEFSDEVGKRLKANRCPRCDGDLARITDHGSSRRYCNKCRMTVIDDWRNVGQ